MSKPLYILFILLAVRAGAQTPALAVADSLFTVGESSKAIELLEKVSPRTVAVNFKLAQYLSAKGKTKESIRYYEEVLDQNPEKILATMEYAKALVKDNQLIKADSVYRELSKKYPENANFYYQRGLIKEQEKNEEAIIFYKSTIEKDKSHQPALYKLAKNELQNRSYDMAKNYALMGLEHYPENVSLLSILAQAYSARALYKKAIPSYEKLIELGEESEFIFTRLGYAYYQEDYLESAITVYQKALEIEDRNSGTHYILGKLYSLQGDLEKSETHLLMAILIKKQPVDAEYLSLALTLKLKKEFKDALGYLNKSLEENPGNERALYELAVVADNHFEDLSSIISYYQSYVDKYDSLGDERLLQLAKLRIADLKKQRHLAGE